MKMNCEWDDTLNLLDTSYRYVHSLTIGHSFKTSYATRSSAGNL